MRTGIVAPLLLGTAGLLQLGVTLPARRQGAAALAEQRSAWAARHDSRQRLAALERRDRARTQAVRLATAAAPGEGDALAALRRRALASLEGSGVSGVRLEVHPGRAPVAATLHLSARGPSPAIIRLAGRLVRPGGGVVLERVGLSPTGDGLALELDGLSLEGRP